MSVFPLHHRRMWKIVYVYYNAEGALIPQGGSGGSRKKSNLLKNQQLKIAYEYFDNKLPGDFCQLFAKSNEMHLTKMTLTSYRTNTLVIPNIKTEHSGRKVNKISMSLLMEPFFLQEIQLTIDSYLNMQKVNSISHFKSLLKKHFKFTYFTQ